MRLHLDANKIANSLQTMPPDALQSHQPAYMAKLVELTTSSLRSDLRSASHMLYLKQALKTKFDELAFSHASPAAWNSLPDYIQSESNTKHSKKLLKLTCLHRHFNSYIVCRNMKYPPFYFVGGQLSLDDDDDDDSSMLLMMMMMIVVYY